jgi:hypothetical protein
VGESAVQGSPEMERLGAHILDPIALHNCQFEVLNGWPQNLSKNLIMYQGFWAKLDHDLKLQFRSEKVRFRGFLRWRDSSVTTFSIQLPFIIASLRSLTDDLRICQKTWSCIRIFERSWIMILNSSFGRRKCGSGVSWDGGTRWPHSRSNCPS